MTKFHINAEGNPGRCDAQPGNCRFSSDEEHFNSKKEARAAYEKGSFEPASAFEVLNRNFRGDALREFTHIAKQIDQEDDSFVEHAGYSEIGRLIYLSDKLEGSKQEFADAAIRKWYGNKTEDIKSIYKKSDDDEVTKKDEDDEKWRNATMNLRYIYTDLNSSKFSDSKQMVNFMFRNADNYIAVGNATNMADGTTSGGGILKKSGFIKLTSGFKNFKSEELRRVAVLHPSAAVELLKRETITDGPDSELVYKMYSNPKAVHTSDFLPAKREALESALDIRSLQGDVDREIYLDASKKLDSPEGIDSKRFAKILQSKLRTAEADSEQKRDLLREIVANTRQAQGRK